MCPASSSSRPGCRLGLSWGWLGLGWAELQVELPWDISPVSQPFPSEGLLDAGQEIPQQLEILGSGSFKLHEKLAGSSLWEQPPPQPSKVVTWLKISHLIPVLSHLKKLPAPSSNSSMIPWSNLSAPISPQELSFLPRRVSLTNSRILLSSAKFKSCQFPGLGKHQASHGSLLQDLWRANGHSWTPSVATRSLLFFFFFSRMI